MNAERLLSLLAGGRPAFQPLDQPAVAEAELLSWIVQATEMARASSRRQLRNQFRRVLGDGEEELGGASKRAPTLLGYVGSRQVLEPHALCPTAEDSGFSAFAERVSRTCLGEGFAVTIPWLNGASWPAQRQLMRLAAPVLQEAGMRSARFNAFFGDYRMTPFGPHLDAHHAHVFQFVIAGERRLLVWHLGELVEALGAQRLSEILENQVDAQRHLPPPTVLEGTPGGVFYWPGETVHAVQADGPSLALSLVFERAPWDVGACLGELLERRARAVGMPPAEVVETPDSAQLGDWWHHLLAQLGERDTSEELARLSARELLRARTGRILEAVPEPRDFAIDVHDHLHSRLVPGFPIACARVAGGLVIAANGHSAYWSDADTAGDVERLIGFLNRCDGFPVAQLCREYVRDGGLDNDDIRALLGFLGSVTALEHANPSDR